MIQRTISIVCSVILIALVGLLNSKSTAAEGAPAAEQGISANNTEREHKDKTVYVIYVENLHCKHCAKRLARKLFAVPGVKKVTANVKKDLAVAYPETKKTLSPLKLWEAAEEAKFKVVKLVTPTDVIEKKPVELARQPVATSNK